MSQRADSSRDDADCRVVRLAWDSDNFGIEVGRIVPPDLDDAQLSHSLRRARDAGMKLVYWMTAEDRVPAGTLLADFGGRLVDQKVTFAAALAELPDLNAGAAAPFRGCEKMGTGSEPAHPNPGKTASGEVPVPIFSQPLRVEEYPCGPASATLKSLALSAGVYSRFRTDPRIPPHVFRSLYETWIDRSTRREIADVVLTAVDAEGITRGLLTLAAVGAEGQIGLLGVDESCRRMGVARQLTSASHRWIAARGIENVSVVTQGDNREARAF